MITGSLVAIVTPMQEDGRLDLARSFLRAGFLEVVALNEDVSAIRAQGVEFRA